MIDTIKRHFISAATYQLFGNKETYCNNLAEIASVVSGLAAIILFITRFDRAHPKTMILPGFLCASSLIAGFAASTLQSDQEKLKELESKHRNLIAKIKQVAEEKKVQNAAAEEAKNKLDAAQAENKRLAEKIRDQVNTRQPLKSEEITALISTFPADNAQSLVDAISQNQHLAPIVTQIFLSHAKDLSADDIPTSQDLQTLRDAIPANIFAQQIAREQKFAAEAQEAMETMQKIEAHQQKVGQQQALTRQAFHKSLPAIEKELDEHTCTNPDCVAFAKKQSAAICAILDSLIPSQ